jgi:penicillin G amidase
MRRFSMQKVITRIALILVGVLLASSIAGTLLLRGSLPALDGRVRARGVLSTTTVERDALGVVTVTGSSRPDVAYGLGYAHGQDRFFQMDLMRRAAAGELSALLGPGTVETDRQLRLHRFRNVARAVVARSTPDQRLIMDAYAAGVNAGLGSLRTRPFEYLLLNANPDPWRAEDSVLCVLSMFLQLQEPDAHTKIERALLASALPESVVRLLKSETPDWDGTLDHTGAAVPILPSPEEYDLRTRAPADVDDAARSRGRPPITGSNNWAVSGKRTASGAALVANDMHLGLRMPNTWYRARVRWHNATGSGADVTGVTLPGTPAIVVGSNGHVAWGFTNSYGDYQELITVVTDPEDGQRYRTAEGSEAFGHAKERIVVRGGSTEELDITTTRWGPVIGRDAKGRPLALAWVAHDSAAVNFGLIELDHATSVGEALDIAVNAGIPAQNFVVGDHDGHIAWTVAGLIPKRRGNVLDVRLSTDPAAGFDGWLAAAEHPRIVDPAEGVVATANSRVVGGEALRLIGDGGYDRGARARQILDDLAQKPAGLKPADMLAVQLDDRAQFLARWKDLLAVVLDDSALDGQPRRAELAKVLRSWTGAARTDDAAYRLVRAWRAEVEQRVYAAMIAPARGASPGFAFRAPPSFEGPLWALVSLRPIHLVPPGATDWRAFLLASVDAVLNDLAVECPKLADCTWGKGSPVHIRHPLSAAVPALADLADMPYEYLPGDADMPRVQGRHFGASERFAVSPGLEKEAYFMMPGGQSGHPMSPYYRAGHENWAKGLAAPFLPGPAEHKLILVP